MTVATAKSLDPADHTLLIVDDIEDNRDLLNRRFGKRGFSVVCAGSGAEALEIIGRGGISLVILDVTMPEMSGLEVLRELRTKASASALPVIMATAHSDSQDVVQALELGANDYVTKPIDFPVLHARVMSALRSLKPPAKAPSPVSREVGPGMVIAGRYVLESKIGEGGFGVVYRAMHTELQHPVAVKVLHQAFMGGDLLARFRREGMHAYRVRHPNALMVLDSGVSDDGVAFLAMELLEGHSLEKEIAAGCIAIVRCAELIAPICEALAVAHSVDVVHRDIKPANVFVHRHGDLDVPKILDFGIAKLLGDHAMSERATVEGSLLGTPAYMAPERFENGPYDGKSDVYSIGVMLNQMLTGQLPFRELTGKTAIEPMALAMMHTTQEPVPLRARGPSVPIALEQLVLRALSKKPSERPTAREMADELRRSVDGVDPDLVAVDDHRVRLGTAPTQVEELDADTSVEEPPTESIRKPRAPKPDSKS